MNKLFTKIAALALGAAMVVGVGVAVSSKNVGAAHAETSSGSVTASGGALSGWTGTVGSKYADGSVKFGTQGNNLAKTDIFSGNVSSGMTNLVVTFEYKINGSGTMTNNAMSVTPYVNGSYGSATAVSGFSSTSKTTKSITVSSGLANCTGFKITYSTKQNGNLALYSLSWTATYTAVTKTLSYIYLDTSSVQTTFTTGDTFNSTGLITTASYTVPATYPDAVVTPTSISTPDMSSSGQKTVTVSYTEGGVTKTATYDIQVHDPRTVSGLTVFDDQLNEIQDGDEITLTASSGNSISADITCEVKYSPSGSDGNVTITSAAATGFAVTTIDNETYTLTFSTNGSHVITIAATEDEDNFSITVTYKVSGLPNVSYVTDTLNNANTINDSTTTSYSEWSGKDNTLTGIESDAVYAGQSAGSNDSIQLRSNNSNSGVITTTSGGNINSITVVFNDNTAATRQISIYGKNTAYSSPTELYGTSAGTELFTSEAIDADKTNLEQTFDFTEINQTYSYFGIRSKSGALYIDHIDITWAVEQEIIDTLNSIEITGSLTTNEYIVGQAISLEGLDVIGHYETAGEVSLLGKSGLTLICTPTTATSSLDEITVEAEYEDKSDSQNYSISVSEDYVTKLTWSSRGYKDTDYFYAGSNLGSSIATGSWSFVPTWASGLTKPAPSYGTGSDDVHVGLYSTYNPTVEGTALTDSYTFTNNDDGKYLVAYYGGVFSTNNVKLNITEVLNEGIIEPASGESGYFLVTDESDLSSGDKIIITSSATNNVMKPYESGNYYNYVSGSLSDDKMTPSSGYGEYTLGVGENGWTLYDGSKYVSAKSSSSNNMAGVDTPDSNAEFSISISSGVATMQAQGSYTRDLIQWNNNSGQYRFSCYGSSQSNGSIKIYKYSEPQDKDLANTDAKVQHFVVAFAKKLLSETSSVCLSEGISSVAELQTAWKNSYDAFVELRGGLEGDDQTLFDKYFKYAQRTPKGQDDSGDTLQNALARYDRVYTQYSLSLSTQGDFLHTISERGSAQPANPNVKIFSLSENGTIAIVVISVVGLAALGGFFFLRKRKEI